MKRPIKTHSSLWSLSTDYRNMASYFNRSSDHRQTAAPTERKHKITSLISSKANCCFKNNYSFNTRNARPVWWAFTALGTRNWCSDRTLREPPPTEAGGTEQEKQNCPLMEISNYPNGQNAHTRSATITQRTQCVWSWNACKIATCSDHM